MGQPTKSKLIIADHGSLEKYMFDSLNVGTLKQSAARYSATSASAEYWARTEGLRPTRLWLPKEVIRAFNDNRLEMARVLVCNKYPDHGLLPETKQSLKLVEA